MTTENLKEALSKVKEAIATLHEYSDNRRYSAIIRKLKIVEAEITGDVAKMDVLSTVPKRGTKGTEVNE